MRKRMDFLFSLLVTIVLLFNVSIINVFAENSYSVKSEIMAAFGKDINYLNTHFGTPDFDSGDDDPWGRTLRYDNKYTFAYQPYSKEVKEIVNIYGSAKYIISDMNNSVKISDFINNFGNYDDINYWVSEGRGDFQIHPEGTTVVTVYKGYYTIDIEYTNGYVNLDSNIDIWFDRSHKIYDIALQYAKVYDASEGIIYNETYNLNNGFNNIVYEENEDFAFVTLTPKNRSVVRFVIVNKKTENIVYIGAGQDIWEGILEQTLKRENITANTSSNISSKPNTTTSIKVMYNGSELKLDTQPQIVNGRTLVPLRNIFEAMGAKVDWENDTKTVTATLNGTTVRFKIGESILYKNGTLINLDVPAQISNEYTMIPVRAVTEVFGSEVIWEDSTKTIYITYNKSEIMKSRNYKTLLIAGYDSDSNYTAAFNKSVDYMELALNQLNVTNITKHYMSDDGRQMLFSELDSLLSKEFSEVSENDISVIYYDGHSYYSDIDSDGNLIGHTTAFSSKSFQDFYDLIKKDTKGTVLLIYDACFAGELFELKGYDNRIKIIATCDKDDESNEIFMNYLVENGNKDERCSIFAFAFYQLVADMSMDLNNDNIISFDELHLSTMNLVMNICQKYTTSQSFTEQLTDFDLHWFEKIGKMLTGDDEQEYKHKLEHRNLAQYVGCYPENDSTEIFNG